MNPNYNAPEYAAARAQLTHEKVANFIDRYVTCAKLMTLNAMDPKAKVASADIDGIADTRLPLVCMAIDNLRKIASKEVTVNDALDFANAITPAEAPAPAAKTASAKEAPLSPIQASLAGINAAVALNQ